MVKLPYCSQAPTQNLSTILIFQDQPSAFSDVGKMSMHLVGRGARCCWHKYVNCPENAVALWSAVLYK